MSALNPREVFLSPQIWRPQPQSWGPASSIGEEGRGVSQLSHVGTESLPYVPPGASTLPALQKSPHTSTISPVWQILISAACEREVHLEPTTGGPMVDPKDDPMGGPTSDPMG